MFLVDDAILQHPFTAMACGPTKSGKSTIVKAILENNSLLITPTINRVVYCYSKWNPNFEDLKLLNVEFIQGLPDLDNFSPSQNNLLILDDLMREAEKNGNILDLFTTDSHHMNISVILISQNLFSQGKYARHISLNCHYLFIMNNPRDKAQIYHLARQMFPNRSKAFMEAFMDAVENYRYIFFESPKS